MLLVLAIALRAGAQIAPGTTFDQTNADAAVSHACGVLILIAPHGHAHERHACGERANHRAMARVRHDE